MILEVVIPNSGGKIAKEIEVKLNGLATELNVTIKIKEVEEYETL